MGPVAQDLSRHMQEQIGAVFERHVRLMQGAVPPADLGSVLLEVATSMSLTSAATAAAMADDQDGAGAIFDQMIASLARCVAGDRERALAAVAARRGRTGA